MENDEILFADYVPKTFAEKNSVVGCYMCTHEFSYLLFVNRTGFYRYSDLLFAYRHYLVNFSWSVWVNV